MYLVEAVEHLDEILEAEWNSLAGENPFIRHGFLRLLQDAGCVSPRTGWRSHHLVVRRDGQLAAVAPAYLKMHSRGEYVFDQSWAQAFEQHGLRYYPKLVVASPFSPVEGPRLLAMDEQSRRALALAIAKYSESAGASSAHVLFFSEEDRQGLLDAGFMLREGVQFHWKNAGYATLNDFLAELSHDKRKKIRQDSKYVAAAGVTFEWLEHERITEAHIEFLYSCYANTYQEHWSTPYLTEDFFKMAWREKTLDLVLVLARREGKPLACALNVKGPNTLYGRYWGTTEMIRGLHFETCYIQSIAYCIEKGLDVFEGGAQGEHKMARGLMPVKTYSAHYVVNRDFASAIDDFLNRETVAVDRYVSDLSEATPFKKTIRGQS